MIRYRFLVCFCLGVVLFFALISFAQPILDYPEHLLEARSAPEEDLLSYLSHSQTIGNILTVVMILGIVALVIGIISYGIVRLLAWRDRDLWDYYHKSKIDKRLVNEFSRKARSVEINTDRKVFPANRI